MDPADMSRIGAGVGDIVEITGKRATAARAMPAYPEERGRSLIQIDGITRENAQAGLGEKVRVEAVSHQLAASLLLSPIGPSVSSYKDRDLRYVARLLEGLPMVSGDRVRATLFGSRAQDFQVTETSPKGIVLVNPATSVRIKGASAQASKGVRISYEDVGGLRKEVQKVREMIELPLRYPEVFERLGIDAPKGVLMYGPPGCGKTLIARAVANETDAYFVHINGPEVIHKFYGESEAHLRGIFDQARQNAPAIVFLDEIDAIAPKRVEVTGEVEKRVVAQLLALMDGLQARGQVIVIGATNIPNSLDPALRRPGRFDREIAISIPDRPGRFEILQIHTRGMPLASGVELEKLAEITHGFVGADLEALCREAAMVALRRLLPKIEFENQYIPYDTLLELEVTMEDFRDALKEIEPSAIREVFTEVPNVRWEEVGGLEEVKQLLRETVEWPLSHRELFEHVKMRPPKGILLYGSPGAGKTLLAKALATEAGVNFISVNGPALMSKYVGESEKAVREVFRKARQASPCIVFFDELDSLAPRRGSSGGDSHATERVVGQLLAEMDGIEGLKGVVVLGATNRPDIIDPGLLRPGRLDLQVELAMPDEAARHRIFQIHTRDKPLADDTDLGSLAKATEGFSGADIELVCHRASMLAVREFLSSAASSEGPASSERLRVAQAHLAGAIEDLKGGLHTLGRR